MGKQQALSVAAITPLFHQSISPLKRCLLFFSGCSLV
jgi:hypothetical protein